MSKVDLSTQISEIESRIKTIKVSKDRILREQAVLEHQYDDLVSQLKEQGIDVEKMKPSEIRDLITKMSADLEKDFQDFVKTLDSAETLIQEFRSAQG